MKFSSDKKTVLVFSDPHQDIDYTEYILRKENYDVAVCLGDWFDSFSRDSEADLEATCKFLKKWIFKPNFFTCIGNHDIQYLYDNPTTICSGYAKSKDDFIVNNFGAFLPAIRDKFLWYVWIDEFFCSHAGLAAHFFPPNLSLEKEALSKWLDEQIGFAIPSLIAGQRHWLYGAGAGRGGRQPFGGITWLDFDTEFEPIDGLKQLVGHSSHPKIVNHVEDGNLDLVTCDNLDIDCHLNQYLLIRNGKLQIKDFKAL